MRSSRSTVTRPPPPRSAHSASTTLPSGAPPPPRRAPGAPFAGGEWVKAGSLLVISAVLLSAGRLGDLLGYRRVYTGGLLLFTVGSGFCGAAHELDALVAARAGQGLGASA